MNKLILKIRNKPEHIKRKIALGVTIFFGIVLVVFWIISFKGQFRIKTQDTAPLNMIKDSIGSAINDVSNGAKMMGQ